MGIAAVTIYALTGLLLILLQTGFFPSFDSFGFFPGLLFVWTVWGAYFFRSQNFLFFLPLPGVLMDVLLFLPIGYSLLAFLLTGWVVVLTLKFLGENYFTRYLAALFPQLILAALFWQIMILGEISILSASASAAAALLSIIWLHRSRSEKSFR